MLVSEFKISGLQCDTPHCNYRDDSIQFEDYPQYINSKCPLCGSVLLTTSDYNGCVRMYNTVYELNRIGNILKWLNPMHYYRLITGKKQEEKIYTGRFPKKKR